MTSCTAAGIPISLAIGNQASVQHCADGAFLHRANGVKSGSTSLPLSTWTGSINSRAGTTSTVTRFVVGRALFSKNQTLDAAKARTIKPLAPIPRCIKEAATLTATTPTPALYQLFKYSTAPTNSVRRKASEITRSTVQPGADCATCISCAV